MQQIHSVRMISVPYTECDDLASFVVSMKSTSANGKHLVGAAFVEVNANSQIVH